MDLPELTPQDAALLARFKADQSPAPDVALRVHRQLRARLVEVEARPSWIVRWSALLRAGGLSVAIAAAVLLVVAGSSRLIARLSVERELPAAASDTVQRRTAAEGELVPREPEPVAPHAASREPIVVPLPPVTDAPTERTDVADALDAPRGRAPARTGKPAAAPAAAPVDAAAEIRLVASVKSERNANARLELIRQHGREFAGGKLLREVAILEIQTLCALGRRDEASTHAKSFVEKNPGSAYAAIAARACEEPGR